MSALHTILKGIIRFGFMLTLGANMCACAGSPSSGKRWKEEVLLHDGQRIIAMRTVERGGRHEIGQRPSAKYESLTFAMPGTDRTIKWEDKYSDDVGNSNFNLLMLGVLDGTAYLVASPMGCLSYNKWGRPNPPYVFFKYEGKEWKRISLQELPAEFKTPNLVISSPDDVAEKASHSLVSAEMVEQENEGFRQPEFKTILREPLPRERINAMCEELILYKGSWIIPNDPVARRMLDRNSK